MNLPLTNDFKYFLKNYKKKSININFFWIFSNFQFFLKSFITLLKTLKNFVKILKFIISFPYGNLNITNVKILYSSFSYSYINAYTYFIIPQKTCFYLYPFFKFYNQKKIFLLVQFCFLLDITKNIKKINFYEILEEYRTYI